MHVDPDDLCPLDHAHRTDWVLAAPFRSRMHELITDTALPWRAIALYAGLPTALIARLVGTNPPRRIPACVALTLLLLRVDELRDLDNQPAPLHSVADGVRHLLQHGRQVDEIARMAQISGTAAVAVLRQRAWCSQRTALLVRAAVQAHALSGAIGSADPFESPADAA